MMRPNDPPSPVKALRTNSSPPRHRNNCGLCCALCLEFCAWALAVVGLCTSFWLVPGSGKLQGLAHAGLWIACHKPASGDTLFSNVNASQPLSEAFSASVSALSTDLHATANPAAEPGCFNAVALFAAFTESGHFAVHLRVMRILAVAFLGFGLSKALAATLAATSFGCLRRNAACLGGLSAVVQLLSGWTVCGLFLYIVTASHLSLSDLGWSWWLFLAALVNATFANASFCCV